MRPFPPKCCKAFGSTFSWHWSPDQELVSALTSGKGFQVLCPSSCTGALQSRETWMAGWWDGIQRVEMGSGHEQMKPKKKKSKNKKQNKELISTGVRL